MNKIALLALAAAFALQAQKPKTNAEIAALNALFNAPDPDTQIKAGDDVLTNFANTEFKSIVLSTMADAYNRKGDYAKTVAYGENALQADPKNYRAMLLLSQTIASHVKDADFDKDARLAEADKYANQAIETLKDAPKLNTAQPDEQWAAQKKDLTADAHQALGISAGAKKKYDVAVSEMKMAVDTAVTPDPATMARLAQMYNKAGKYDDAIATADKVMAIKDVNPAIRQYAQAEKVRATQAKAAPAK